MALPIAPQGTHGSPCAPQVVGDVPGDLQGLRLRTLRLGGLLGDSGTVEEGFQGCLQVWRHGLGGCGEHGLAGVGVEDGLGDVEEGVRTRSQWEGSTWTWGHGRGLVEMGTGMRTQMLGMWHRLRTGHNEARPCLEDEDMGTMKRGTGTWVHCLGTWHRAWGHGPRAWGCSMGWGQGTVKSGTEPGDMGMIKRCTGMLGHVHRDWGHGHNWREHRDMGTGLGDMAWGVGMWA